MVDYECYCQIKKEQQLGLTASQIAQKLQMDSRTVKKWLSVSHYRQRQTITESKLLDPYKDDIVALLERYPYSATQVFQQIQANGFKGSYSLVKVYVRQIRPKRPPAYLTLAFAPGDYAQVDWGIYKTIRIGSTRRQLSFFVMVLCHSRMMYVEFVTSQKMDHFLACHQHAFTYFGGVPKFIMVDNLKSAVLKRITGSEPIYNPKYLDFAQHYGFTIKACGVRKGNEKGRVERSVGYVKQNFLAGRELNQFEALQSAIDNWLTTVANCRIHGETRKKPIDQLSEDRAKMQALPIHPYDIARIETIRANKLFRITFECNRYSVPAEYASTALTLKIYPRYLCIYYKDTLVARHQRCFDRHQDIENPDHPKELLTYRRKARIQKIYQRFIALSPKSQDYYQQLETRRMNPTHHVRKIVGLSEIYGIDAVRRAMDDAFVFNAFSSEYIANLLEQRNKPITESGALQLIRQEDALDIELEEPNLTIYQIPDVKGDIHD